MEYEDYGTSSIDMNKTMVKTFFWMFLGLLSTAIISLITYNSESFVSVINAWPILAIVEVAIVIIFRLALRRAPASVVTALFFIYAMVNGLTFSALFAFYDLGTIAYTFFATAGIFGALALIGYTTKRDISGIGTILMVGLLVSILLSVVNIFIGSSAMDMGIDLLVIAIFCGFTIFDVNNLKLMASSGELPSDKVEIYCALELYLDFINLFIRLLSIFGRRD